jgi:hypothetical protein
MTANEMIDVYKSANKYKSLRFKRAKYKVQDFLGYWRTLYCFEDIMAARGYITMCSGRATNVRFRVVDRAGKIVYE